MKNALKLGPIMAVISTVISLIIYLTDYSVMFDWKFSVIMMIANLIIAVALGRKLLRPTDYVGLSYGEALKYLFVAFIISGVISSVFQITMFGNNKQFKTDFIEYSQNASIAGLEWGMDIAGSSEAEIEMEVEKMKDKMESGEIPEPTFPYKWSSLPVMLLGNLFGALIIALIVAIFVKQKG
jgi:hypothetical protein